MVKVKKQKKSKLAIFKLAFEFDISWDEAKLSTQFRPMA